MPIKVDILHRVAIAQAYEVGADVENLEDGGEGRFAGGVLRSLLPRCTGSDGDLPGDLSILPSGALTCRRIRSGAGLRSQIEARLSDVGA